MSKTMKAKTFAAAALALTISANADADNFEYTPDAKVPLAGREVPVDIALLGNNGEETVGFYASLDPFHGLPFQTGWLIKYSNYIKDNPRNTNPEDVKNVLNQVMIHGVKEKDLKDIYKMAKNAWEQNPQLRFVPQENNRPQP